MLPINNPKGNQLVLEKQLNEKVYEINKGNNNVFNFIVNII